MFLSDERWGKPASHHGLSNGRLSRHLCKLPLLAALLLSPPRARW